MNDDAKPTAGRWRRALFGLHLFVWMIVRLMVGSLPEMPPAGTYEALFAWGLLVFGHWLLLSLQEGRDRVELPFHFLNRLIVPRERRWLLLVIDAMLWFMSEAGAAGLLFSSYYGYLVMRYETAFSLLWLAQTVVVVAHLGLAAYAEIHDRSATKRKNDDNIKAIPALRLGDDGELSIENLDYDSADKEMKESL
jgi:hypothetical protein